MDPKESKDASETGPTTISRIDGSRSMSSTMDSARAIHQSFDIQDARGLQLDERRNKGALWVAHYDDQISMLESLRAKVGPERAAQLNIAEAIETRRILRERAKKEFGLYAYQAESKKVDCEDTMTRLANLLEECRNNPAEERLV